MGIYVSTPEDASRLWYVDRVDGGSNADGSDLLVDNGGRLVGVLKGTEGAGKNLESNPLEVRVLAALRNRTAFEHSGVIYAPVQGVKVNQ